MEKDLAIILDINTSEIERLKKYIKIVYEEERHKNQEASVGGLSETFRLLDVGYRGDLYDLNENIDRIIEKKFKELKNYYNICVENANLYRIDYGRYETAVELGHEDAPKKLFETKNLYIYWKRKALSIKNLMNKIMVDMGHSFNNHIVDTDSIRTITLLNIPYVIIRKTVCNCVICGEQIDYDNPNDIWIHGVFSGISSPSFEKNIPEFIREWGLSDENIPLRIDTEPLIVNIDEIKLASVYPNLMPCERNYLANLEKLELEQSKSIQTNDNQLVMNLKRCINKVINRSK